MVDDYADLENLLADGQIPQLDLTIYESYWLSIIFLLFYSFNLDFRSFI